MESRLARGAMVNIVRYCAIATLRKGEYQRCSNGETEVFLNLCVNIEPIS